MFHRKFPMTFGTPTSLIAKIDAVALPRRTRSIANTSLAGLRGDAYGRQSSLGFCMVKVYEQILMCRWDGVAYHGPLAWQMEVAFFTFDQTSHSPVHDISPQTPLESLPVFQK